MKGRAYSIPQYETSNFGLIRTMSAMHTLPFRSVPWERLQDAISANRPLKRMVPGRVCEKIPIMA